MAPGAPKLQGCYVILNQPGVIRALRWELFISFLLYHVAYSLIKLRLIHLPHSKPGSRWSSSVGNINTVHSKCDEQGSTGAQKLSFTPGALYLYKKGACLFSLIVVPLFAGAALTLENNLHYHH